MANDTDKETRVRTVFRPALDSHRFFEQLFAIERSSQGLGRLARMSVLFRAMPEYVGFPLPLRLSVLVLASITRVLGYRLPAGSERHVA